jgi:hypothetical protein
MKLIHEDVVIEQVIGVLAAILTSLGGSHHFFIVLKSLVGCENVV